MRLRGGDTSDIAILGGAGVCCLAVALILLFLCVSWVNPNYYGLQQNRFTKSFGQTVRGGVHVIGPLDQFLVFPATQQVETIEIVNARLAGGQGSSGQTVSLSCTFQYVVLGDHLQFLIRNYSTFENTKLILKQYAESSITSTTNVFTADDFWERRSTIIDAMSQNLNASCVQHVFVKIVHFQIVDVRFSRNWETAILKNSTTNQQTYINKNIENWTLVNSTMSIYNATNDAKIQKVLAEANANLTETKATAKKVAFNRTQSAKGRKYAELQSILRFDGQAMSEYFKVKAITAENKVGKLLASVPSPLEL